MCMGEKLETHSTYACLRLDQIGDAPASIRKGRRALLIASLCLIIKRYVHTSSTSPTASPGLKNYGLCFWKRGVRSGSFSHDCVSLLSYTVVPTISTFSRDSRG
jgi:hypothetical protein